MNQTENRLQLHAEGKTQYIDDITLPPDGLLGYVVHSPHAHARILSINTEKALKLSGIAAILTSKDIPGTNDMGSVTPDEPILAEKTVNCIGQAILLIAARSPEAARRAAELIEIEYQELKPLLDIEQSFSQSQFPFTPYHLKKGKPKESLRKSPHTIKGTLEIGGQEHYYLETQGAFASYRDENILHIKASTQNPSEAQHIITKALSTDNCRIEVETGHLGGGFGGKETQGNWCAVWAALLTHKTGKPVKLILPRDQDMLITGKRHPVKAHYQAGFDDTGKLLAYQVRFLFNTGYASDLSQSICERCLLHAENAYYIPSVEIDIYPCRTNTASNCAFRGFGAPQGIATIENILDQIAQTLNLDPLQVRKENYYGIRKRNITPYGQKVSDNSLPYIHRRLLSSSDYKNRTREIKKYNKAHTYTKRALGVTPVKFGISFTTTFLNQGSAIVNLYRDGSLTIHQGGVEMGQGLYDKITNIAAKELSIPKEKIKIYNTNTSIIPNTSATAASTGSDINGQATLIAVRKIKNRLNKIARTLPKGTPIEEIINTAYIKQVNLSEKAFWKTPGIHFNKVTCKGKPFFYYVWGLSISEIELDCLTGTPTILRTDILHDTGLSLDPEIDKGQIEGAYIQSAGWCTMEELIWDDKGYPVTANADSYKIPGIADIPADFRVELYQKNPFYKGIFSSRAVGEPPFIYGLSVWSAIKNAVKAYTGKDTVQLPIPATKETIIQFINQ